MKNSAVPGTSVVITGATSGIGFATVRKFLDAGSFVIGVGRSAERNHASQIALQADRLEGKAEFVLGDLSAIDQVRQTARVIKRLLHQNGYKKLDILVNNAGVYLEKKQMTEDNIEKTFAVNHLAPFLMTHELMPLLSQSKLNRVLTVTSYSHRTTPLCLNRITNPKPYIGLLAYKRSKLCNILFSQALNRKQGVIKAVAVDPGLVNTGIASKENQGISDWIWRIKRHNGVSADVPAEMIFKLACAQSMDYPEGLYYKDHQFLQPSRAARREDLADALWSLSCRLTGIVWRS